MSSNIKSIIELVDGILNDINNKQIQSYILKTRIDRIIMRLDMLREEEKLDEFDKSCYSFELKYESTGCYGGGSYISNLEDVVKQLKIIRDILANVK